jgi:hypothetical protein
MQTSAKELGILLKRSAKSSLCYSFIVKSGNEISHQLNVLKLHEIFQETDEIEQNSKVCIPHYVRLTVRKI